LDHDGAGIRHGAVVDDDDLGQLVALGDQRVQTVRKQPRPIPRGDDDREGGLSLQDAGRYVATGDSCLGSCPLITDGSRSPPPLR
jgi:hypothetical protein